MITLCVMDGARQLARVQTGSTDDFYYFRDSVHALLEVGEFGSSFPTFLCRFEPDRWEVEELPQLQRELEAIAAAFKKLPPEPPDSNWQSKLASSGRKPRTLYDVYLDAEGKPLLGELIALCALARKEGKPILLE
ncbi:MAG: hypothetical protein HY703_07585 [Gemmatimonadetes bacterium]|nr:hypothetical protein [Gemmatimonadota bacterium]